LACACVAALLLAPALVGQAQSGAVESDTAQSGDAFGSVLALSGPTLVVGAPSGGPGHAGSVSVFEQVGPSWLEIALFTKPAGNAGSGFGAAVDVDGNRAVGGGPLLVAPGKQGLVQVYQRSAGSWSVVQTLLPPGAGGEFGRAVALSGERLAVGAPFSDAVGAVTLYEWSGVTGSYEQSAHLLAPAGIGFGFGSSVALDGDTLVIGDPGANVVAPASGVAWIFERHPTLGWQPAAQLAPFVSTPSSMRFGHAVAVEGTRAVVTALGQPQFGTAAGAAFVYERTPGGWVLKQMLTLPGFGQPLGLGSSVALQGDVLLLGAPHEDLGIGKVGTAHLYRRHASSWTHEQTLAADDGLPDDEFGAAAALEGTLGVLGAPRAGFSASDSGAVYIYSGFDPWKDEGGALAGTNGAPLLTGTGSLMPGAATTLRVTGALPGAPLHLLVGFSVQNLPFKGGTLVPLPVLIFHGLATDAAGGFVLSFGWLSSFPSMFPTTFQAWIADAGGPAGFAATNGLTGTTP
jgi:hypothetical protein